MVRDSTPAWQDIRVKGVETMRDVLSHRASTDRVRQAVMTAAEGMSRHYREQLQRASGGR